ncbi:hypothetical protein KP509_17G049800 [Ceratopteris richardii]|nr:hypothetical protein KP509_17G049800 [Ceratopteris richardii]
MHTFLFNSRIPLSLMVGNSLIDMYAKCGDIEHAWQVFDTMPSQDAISWNIMIAAFSRVGQIEEAFTFFNNMEKADFDPDEVTFLSILKACSTIDQGKQVYAYILKKNINITTFVGNTLIDLFVKCKNMTYACEVFDQMHEHDTLTWTMLVSAHDKLERTEEPLLLFSRMVQECALPNIVTFVSTLGSCMLLHQGKRLHAQYSANRFPASVILGNTLIDMYARCGDLQSAQAVFDEMPELDIISWNTLIAGYAVGELGEEALDLFFELLDKQIEPDSATYLGVFKGCAAIGVLECCQLIHSHLFERNLFVDIYLESAIIDTYAKCWSITDAHHLFNKMAKYDVVSWNTIMAALVNHGQSEEVLDLFRQMEFRDLKPDAATFLSVLRACASAGYIDQGRVVHGYIIEGVLESHLFLSVSLIDFYAKCQSMEDAGKVFKLMPIAEDDVVAWNAIIAGHAEHDQFEQALELYERMIHKGGSPDTVTFVGALKASANLSALDKGLQIHNFILKVGQENNIYVGSTLVDMYGKCGSADDAYVAFKRMQERDIVTWNSMIACYALLGLYKEAMDSCNQMLVEQGEIDPITLVNVLTACSHAGLVDQGYMCFSSLVKGCKSTPPTVDHYACIVDLFGRAGMLQEGLNFCESMPIQPTEVVWTSLVGACRFLGEAHLGLYAAEALLELDPDDNSTLLQLVLLYYQLG